MIRTNSQNKILHWQLGELNIPQDVKEDLVHQFTNGRATRSSQMAPNECQALINHLNVVIKETKKTKTTVAKNDGGDKMRKKILSICHEMGWKLEGGKIDMARVNDFCLKKGCKHKLLDDYTRAELPLLITQFERVLKDYYAKR